MCIQKAAAGKNIEVINLKDAPPPILRKLEEEHFSSVKLLDHLPASVGHLLTQAAYQGSDAAFSSSINLKFFLYSSEGVLLSEVAQGKMKNCDHGPRDSGEMASFTKEPQTVKQSISALKEKATEIIYILEICDRVEIGGSHLPKSATLHKMKAGSFADYVHTENRKAEELASAFFNQA